MSAASTKLTSRYGEALIYATAAHDGQFRKGCGIPYISHPVAVSALVIEHGGTEDQAIAGLLHDVIEDCGLGHEAEIEARFGLPVLKMVEGLTDGIPDATGEKPEWRGRKERYLAHLADAADDVILVSAADKLHNAASIAVDFAVIGDTVFDRFSSSKDQTIWYYATLADVLGARLGRQHGLIRRLDAAVQSWAG